MDNHNPMKKELESLDEENKSLKEELDIVKSILHSNITILGSDEDEDKSK